MKLLAISLFAAAMVLAGSHVLAQSGVQSGPPQVRGGQGPNSNPGPNNNPSPGPGSGVDQPSGTLPSSSSWVAVAAGFREGRYVRVGFARRGSRGEAEDAAVNACNGGPGGVRCSNPYASSTGCLFIVAGKRQGGVTWGRGSNREVALSECRRGGYTCRDKDVVGGCTD